MGIRVTAQRLAVAAILASSKDHPTAQEVYERVREHFPQITLGTIYNTMNMLTEKCFVQALGFANGTRYDTNLLSHANLVCVDCGRIVDADDDDGMVTRLRDQVKTSNGFEVIGQRVDFLRDVPGLPQELAHQVDNKQTIVRASSLSGRAEPFGATPASGQFRRNTWSPSRQR